jgi:RNA polymerase sigma factor (sigma-70 family)
MVKPNSPGVLDAIGEKHQEPDVFTRAVIHKTVKRLLKLPLFDESEGPDLRQELMHRVLVSLASFDSSVGHPYPFIHAIVKRQAASIARGRRAHKRSARHVRLLSGTADDNESNGVRLQSVLNEDQDRRLARERRLSDQELVELRADLATLLSGLPPDKQRVIALVGTKSISEISGQLGVPRSTINSWLRDAETRCRELGMDEYF